MKTWTTKDKTNWGEGPWQTEPDKAQWVDEKTGLDCLMVRNYAGAWCGYVGVPPSHPAFEKEYSDIDIDVHGGLTFSDRCRPSEDEAHGICHTGGANEEVWWLGFDCAHAGDLMPATSVKFGFDVYQDFDAVKSEVERLAMQAQEWALGFEDQQ